MPVTQQSVTLVFQDPSGTPIANGRVTIRLQQDISTGVASGPQISAGIVASAVLDSSGTATVSLWPTSMMEPPAVYFVTAYTSLGQPAWSGELTV